MKETKIKNRKYGRIISPGILLPLAIAGLIIVVVSSWMEYKLRQEDYLKMLENQATLFMKTLNNTTRNAFNAAAELENEISKKMYSGLQLLERLDEKEKFSNNTLSEMLEITGFDEIHIYGSDKKLRTFAAENSNLPAKIDETVLSRAVQSGQEESFVTISLADNLENDRFGVIFPAKTGGVYAGIINNEQIRNFRKIFGFGQFLKSFSSGEGVEYIVLENSETIIAGFFIGYTISSFSDDPFLAGVFSQKGTKTRILNYNGVPVFEALVPFSYESEPVGILRMGLSMNKLEILNAKVKRRMFVFSGLLVIFGLVLVNFTLSYRHRHLLKKDLEYLNKYTNKVLDNLESGVISVDENEKIQFINKKASYLLGTDYADLYNNNINTLPDQFAYKINLCMKNGGQLDSIEKFYVSNEEKNIWVSFRSTRMKTDEGHLSCILLIDDVTEQVKLEEQIRRNEKLTAMKKLASAVAHEVRNPLNSISLIIDLLKKYFEPVKNKNKYDSYINTLHNEIKRISRIVQEFLQFTRPPKINPASIDFIKFFSEIETLLSIRMESEDIKLRLDIEPHSDCFGDPDQLKQVFVNIMENSIQAVNLNGEILVSGKSDSGFYSISVKDNGCGISEQDLNNIFDLYYTTKKNGSGIGLAVVHQIISQHGGAIDVKSKNDSGTEFTVQLPLDNKVTITNQIKY